MEILVEYNGKYPCLCLGRLKITINGTPWEFPRPSLISGGRTYFTNNYSEAQIEEGPWKIRDWPDNFPEEYKEAVLEAINNELPQGCCGGCL